MIIKELNDVCDEIPVDIGKLYVRLYSLVSIYVQYAIQPGEEFWEEDIIQEITLYLIYDRKIHTLKRTTHNIWWRFTQRIGAYQFNLICRNDQEFKKLLYQVTQDSEGVLDFNDEKTYLLPNKKHVNSLIKKGIVGEVIDLVTLVDEPDRSLLQWFYERYLKKVDTDVLLSAYKRLLSSYSKEYFQCRGTLKRLFYKQNPSARKRSC